MRTGVCLSNHRYKALTDADALVIYSYLPPCLYLHREREIERSGEGEREREREKEGKKDTYWLHMAKLSLK